MLRVYPPKSYNISFKPRTLAIILRDMRSKTHKHSCLKFICISFVLFCLFFLMNCFIFTLMCSINSIVQIPLNKTSQIALLCYTKAFVIGPRISCFTARHIGSKHDFPSVSGGALKHPNWGCPWVWRAFGGAEVTSAKAGETSNVPKDPISSVLLF